MVTCALCKHLSTLMGLSYRKNNWRWSPQAGQLATHRGKDNIKIDLMQMLGVRHWQLAVRDGNSRK